MLVGRRHSDRAIRLFGSPYGADPTSGHLRQLLARHAEQSERLPCGSAQRIAPASSTSTPHLAGDFFPRRRPHRRRWPWSGSLIITSQEPIDRWYEIVGNPTIADAVLDRLVHGANRIELKGESMRKLKAAKARLDEAANK